MGEVRMRGGETVGAEGLWRAEVATVAVTCGAGALARLGEVAGSLGGTRAFLVTDPGLRQAGHPDRAASRLTAAGLAVELFAGVVENPSADDVAAATEAARAFAPDLLVGLGGGSALDVTKGVNFLLTQGGVMEDYWGFGKAAKPMLPSIGLPTTAGTGSDAQSFALIAHPKTHRKMACGDVKARFRAVLLDPELAATAPRMVVATAGIDALSHAVETRVTRRRNPLSHLLSGEAWRLLAAHLEAAFRGEATLGDWEALLWGAHLAGAAIEASMLGAAHAAANPLTAVHGTVHGTAVGLMLPHVVRWNGSAVGDLYASLEGIGGGGEDGAERLARRIESLRREAGLAATLEEAGVDLATLPELARRATEEWTGTFNPRPLTEADFLALYQAALVPPPVSS